MKRALFDTVSVLPFESGSVFDRTGYESAVLAVTIAAGAQATVKVEHSDTIDGTFAAVPDSRLFVDNPVDKTTGDAIITNEAEADAVANLDIDLIGCKAFVKITVTGGTAGALALGDATDAPVGVNAAAASSASAGNDDTGSEGD